MEPIVFSDVYPLYALSDIRGSSTLRADAIRTDLLTQLQLARDVVETAHAVKPLPPSTSWPTASAGTGRPSRAVSPRATRWG